MIAELQTRMDRFAELLARLDDPFARRADVLRDAGLDEEACRALRGRWAAQMKASPEGGDVQSARFGEAYARASQALRDARRVVREGASDAPPSPAAEAPAFQGEAARVPLLAAPEEAPPALDSPWIPKSMRGFTEVAGTQLAPSAAVGQRALPFDPNARSSLPPQEPPSSRPVVPASMSGFTDVDGTQAAPEPPVSAPNTLHVSKPVVPASMSGFTDVDGTQMATEPVRESVLPFAGPPPVKAPPVTPPATPPRPNPPASRSATLMSGVAPTAPTAPVSAAGPVSSRAPESAPGAARQAPSLSVEQFASLCVELEISPAQRADVLRRYHLSEEGYRLVDGGFRARFAADPAALAAFQQAFSAYKAWLLHQRATSR